MIASTSSYTCFIPSLKRGGGEDPKVKLKIAFTDKERVMRSPYYVCNQLWDKLDVITQSSKNRLRATDLSVL